jgi:hypothetical protein
MYKITIVFTSDIQGIYTQHIETVDEDEPFFIRMKIIRMINRWTDILLSHINFEEFLVRVSRFENPFKHINYCETMDPKFKEINLEEANLKIYMIKQHIEFLNDFDRKKPDSLPRTWNITIEKI